MAAPSATLRLLERRYPHVASDPRAEAELLSAAAELDATLWGSNYSAGIAALAAHYLEANPLPPAMAGDPIPVEPPKAPRATTMPAMTLEEAVLAHTAGGRAFLRLRAALGSGLLGFIRPG